MRSRMKAGALRTPLFSSDPPHLSLHIHTKHVALDTLADLGFSPHCRDKPSEVEGFPQRSWHIEVWLVNEKGALVPANLFDKVTYHLHPSFGERATQGMF